MRVERRGAHGSTGTAGSTQKAKGTGQERGSSNSPKAHEWQLCCTWPSNVGSLGDVQPGVGTRLVVVTKFVAPTTWSWLRSMVHCWQ